jgi:two-component system phosphate regulon response regulator PhoB
LRKALEDFGYDRLVQTVRGAGYRFSARADA